MGIEPTPSAWKAEVLPLNYTRPSFPPARPGHRSQPPMPRRTAVFPTRLQRSPVHGSRRFGPPRRPSRPSSAGPRRISEGESRRRTGGGGRIRTFEGISRQIYSLLPLAAWVPLRQMSRVFSGRRVEVSTASQRLPPTRRPAAIGEGRFSAPAHRNRPGGHDPGRSQGRSRSDSRGFPGRSEGRPTPAAVPGPGARPTIYVWGAGASRRRSGRDDRPGRTASPG
jgi:hypothetical protein